MLQQAIQQSMVKRMQNSGSALLDFAQWRKSAATQIEIAPILGSMNSLEARLARSADEIAKAQSLRYQVFYREMAAKGSALSQFTRKDKDHFDDICDHLLVVDRDLNPKANVIATYRMLRQEVAAKHGGFYSTSEFDLAPILAAHCNLNFLELGRSCVKSEYRNKRTIELLWQGSWSYIVQHKIDVMIGCASLQGTDPVKLALPLSFLCHHARAPESWRTRAVKGRGSSMDMIAKQDINAKEAVRALPPLIKGYLRLGAWVGDEAVVDHQFGTTDVLIILPVAKIKQRYLDYYNAKISR